jgi:predicted nucleotidyltransferase
MQVLLAIFIQRVAETVDTQERIKTAVANVLEQDQRLVFAYIYGSFARAEAFRDIDVGVYLRDPEEDPFGVSFDVKERVSRSLQGIGIDTDADLFDVKILNGAPFTFLKRVFIEGLLMLDRDPELRTDLIEHVSMKYRECAGLMAEASLL